MGLTVLPTVVFDSAGSSDTTASGAGNVAANGTAAATNNTTTVTLTDGGVDLTGLNQDGSAVLWVLSSSGRQFSRISTFSGSVGNWSVVCQDTFTQTESGRTWAIGGKRATIDGTNSRKLFTADLKSGWTVQINANMTVAGGNIALVNAGDLTTGYAVITGNADSGSQPILTTTTNVACFGIPASSAYKFAELAFQCSSGTRTTAYGINSAGSALILEVVNCVFGDGTNKLANGIFLNNSVSTVKVRDTEFKNCTGTGILLNAGAPSEFVVINCKIHDCGGSGIDCSRNIKQATIRDCVIYGNTSDGITSTNGTGVDYHLIANCTIHNNGGQGINFSNAPHTNIDVYDNNITKNGGYGVQWTLTPADQVKGIIDYNCFGAAGDSTTNTSGAYHGITAGAHDQISVSPQYTNAGGTPPNFAVGTNVKAKGYPDSTRTLGGNTGGTTTYEDIGAAQRQEAGGGGMLVHPGMDGGCRG